MNKAEGSMHGQIDIYLDFEKGFKFPGGRTHDTISRTWQHLNFFQHTCFLHARVPRLMTDDGKVENAKVPWARPGSGFTLLFEAFGMLLIESEMPVNRAASVLDIYPQRLWNIFSYWINKAYQSDAQADIRVLGIDETSSRKGHSYVTVAVDMESRRVIHAFPGKGADTIESIQEHLDGKGCKKEQIHPGRFRYPVKCLFDADIYFLCLLLPELPDNIFKQFYFLMPGTERIADRQCQT
jgi:transposase